MKQQELITHIAKILNEINDRTVANFMAKVENSLDLNWCPLLELRISTHYIYVCLFDRVIWDHDTDAWGSELQFKQHLEKKVKDLVHSIVSSLDNITIGLFSDGHMLYRIFNDGTSDYDLPVKVNGDLVEIEHDNEKMEIRTLLKPSACLQSIAKVQRILEPHFDLKQFNLTNDDLAIQGIISE